MTIIREVISPVDIKGIVNTNGDFYYTPQQHMGVFRLDAPAYDTLQIQRRFLTLHKRPNYTVFSPAIQLMAKNSTDPTSEVWTTIGVDEVAIRDRHLARRPEWLAVYFTNLLMAEPIIYTVNRLAADDAAETVGLVPRTIIHGHPSDSTMDYEAWGDDSEVEAARKIAVASILRMKELRSDPGSIDGFRPIPPESEKVYSIHDMLHNYYGAYMKLSDNKR